MNKRALFWVGLLLCSSLVGTAAAQTDKPPAAAQKRSTTSSRTSRSSTAYSAARARARRTKLARARAAAKAREAKELALPHYKVDESGALVPDLHAEAAVIYDPETNKVLWEQNAQEQRSIASITKVMTATVFLEDDPDLSQQVTIVPSDVYRASTTHLRRNDTVTTGDLLHLLLIASDNAAARALARVSPYGPVGFVRRMNEKAVELGLLNTSYADPSGLLSDNVSSAYDMARLITLASNDERIASIMRLPEYTVRTARHRVIAFRSTDHLLNSPDVDVRAAKTGFISKAGYCFATLLKMPQGSEIAVVVLGARSNAARFLETRNLFQWMSTQASSLLSAAPEVPEAPEPQVP